MGGGGEGTRVGRISEYLFHGSMDRTLNESLNLGRIHSVQYIHSLSFSQTSIGVKTNVFKDLIHFYNMAILALNNCPRGYEFHNIGRRLHRYITMHKLFL